MCIRDRDDAAWHLESIQEKGLPVDEINAYNHMAIYLRWCMEHDLMSAEFMERYWEQVQLFMADLSRADLRGFIRDQLKGQLFGALFNKEDVYKRQILPGPATERYSRVLGRTWRRNLGLSACL